MRECVCLAALQGGQADAGEVGSGKQDAGRLCATWGDRREARYNRPMPKKVGAAAALSRLEA